MNTATEEFLPCPFCGTTTICPHVDNHGQLTGVVGCPVCGATAPSSEAWNRRVDEGLSAADLLYYRGPLSK